MAVTAAVMIAAAAVIAAGVAFAMVMVITLDVGVKGEVSSQEVRNRCIRITGHTAVKLNAGLCQGHLGTAADAATDQHICI